MTSAKPKPPSPHHAPVPVADCALARAIRVIGDGPTLLILREALLGVERFEAMSDDLGIPRSVLSARLAKLVEAGIFERRPYREPGQRTRQRYVLTEKGRSLTPALIAMRDWARTHLPGTLSGLRFKTQDGVEVGAPLMRADGTTLAPDTPLVIAFD